MVIHYLHTVCLVIIEVKTAKMFCKDLKKDVERIIYSKKKKKKK